MNIKKWASILGVAAFAGGCGQAQNPPSPAASFSGPTAGATPVETIEPEAQNVVAQPAAEAQVDPNTSPAVAEIVKLYESGVGDDVVLSYIQNSQVLFDLSADDVLYLKDVGVPSQVVTAMLDHDTKLRASGVAATAPPGTISQPAAPQAAPVEPPTVTAPLTPSANAEFVGNPPPDVNYFYNDLAPYGSWISLEGVGWCWQPTVVVVNRGWQPYCDRGHWINSDCGWYWQSDYSWGWAPFHYGRWHLHPRCGWVWLPDRTWGPAWVSWRTSGDACGWAPLPPHVVFDAHRGWIRGGVTLGFNVDFGLPPSHFTFVAFKDFGARDYRAHRFQQTEVTKIYNKTKIINNYTVVNNKQIVNHGVPVERVSKESHTEFKKAVVRDLPAGASRGTRVDASTRGNPVVYRHELKSTTRTTTKVVAQKVDSSHPVVQHVVAPPAARRTVSNSRAVNPRAGNANISRNQAERTVRSPDQNRVPTVNAPKTPNDQSVRQNKGSRSAVERGTVNQVAPGNAVVSREAVNNAARENAARQNAIEKANRETARENAIRENAARENVAREARNAAEARSRASVPTVTAPNAPVQHVNPRSTDSGVGRYTPKNPGQSSDSRLSRPGRQSSVERPSHADRGDRGDRGGKDRH